VVGEEALELGERPGAQRGLVDIRHPQAQHLRMTPTAPMRNPMTGVSQVSYRVGRWFLIVLFGLLLAGIVNGVVLVVAVKLGLPALEWLVSGVIVACIAAVWMISRTLLPAGGQVRVTDRGQPRV
jgi:hypothetical protein